MNKVKVFQIILLTFFLSFNGIAQTVEVASSNAVIENLEQTIAKEISLKLELSRLILESSNAIDSEIERQFSKSENPFNDSKKLTSIITTELDKYESFYEKALNIPKEKIPLFRKFFQSLDWNVIIPLMKKAHVGAEVFFKKKGYGLGISIMTGKAIKYALLYALVKFNLSAYSPVIFSIPWTLIFSTFPATIQSIRIKSDLVKVLGSKERVNAFLKQEEMMLHGLQLKNPKDLIMPLKDLEGEEMEAVIIKNQPLWKNVLAYMDFKSDELNIFGVKDFLKENKITSPYIDWVFKEKNLDGNQKLFLVIGHIFSVEGQEVQMKFRQKFSGNFVKGKKNASWSAILNWSRSMKSARTMEELKEQTRNIPAEIKPKEIALIWENVLLPEYVSNMDLSYNEARNMLFYFESLKAKLYLLPDNASFEQTQHEMFAFFEKALKGKKFSGCKKSHDEVGKYLLEKAVL